MSMRNIVNKIDKLYICFCITMVLGIIVFPFVYAGTYKVINFLDSSIFNRYATEGRFKDNQFFSISIEEETGIIQQLYSEIEEFEGVDRIQEFANVIRLNEDEVIRIINQNESYCEYLLQIDCDVKDIFHWSEKMASLDQTLMGASLYLVLLIMFIMMVAVFDFRALFYLIAGMVYLIATLSLLSDGISDYVVVKLLSLLSDDVIYDNVEDLKLFLCQIFKESALTFIIFETVIQIYRSRKEERKEKEIVYLYHSVCVQIEYLQKNSNTDNDCILRLRLPYKYILRQCNKIIHRCEKGLRKKRLLDCIRMDMREQKEQYLVLKDSLVYLSNNTETHAVKTYIEMLGQIQYLLYKCFVSSYAISKAKNK